MQELLSIASNTIKLKWNDHKKEKLHKLQNGLGSCSALVLVYAGYSHSEVRSKQLRKVEWESRKAFCYGLNCVPPQIPMLRSYCPVPHNVTLFGDKVFTKVIKLKWENQDDPILISVCWYNKNTRGTSLVVQWLGLWASNAGGMGSIPGWGTKIPHAARRGQKKITRDRVAYTINIYFLLVLGSPRSRRSESGDWVWWGPIFQFINGHVLTVSLYGRRGEGALWGLFYKGTNPIYEGSTFKI